MHRVGGSLCRIGGTETRAQLAFSSKAWPEPDTGKAIGNRSRLTCDGLHLLPLDALLLLGGGLGGNGDVLVGNHVVAGKMRNDVGQRSPAAWPREGGRDGTDGCRRGESNGKKVGREEKQSEGETPVCAGALGTCKHESREHTRTHARTYGAAPSRGKARPPVSGSGGQSQQEFKMFLSLQQKDV